MDHYPYHQPPFLFYLSVARSLRSKRTDGPHSTGEGREGGREGGERGRGRERGREGGVQSQSKPEGSSGLFITGSATETTLSFCFSFHRHFHPSKAPTSPLFSSLKIERSPISASPSAVVPSTYHGPVLRCTVKW